MANADPPTVCSWLARRARAAVLPNGTARGDLGAPDASDRLRGLGFARRCSAAASASASAWARAAAAAPQVHEHVQPPAPMTERRAVVALWRPPCMSVLSDLGRSGMPRASTTGLAVADATLLLANTATGMLVAVLASMVPRDGSHASSSLAVPTLGSHAWPLGLDEDNRTSNSPCACAVHKLHADADVRAMATKLSPASRPVQLLRERAMNIAGDSTCGVGLCGAGVRQGKLLS